jgi:hypothetical protein
MQRMGWLAPVTAVALALTSASYAQMQTSDQQQCSIGVTNDATKVAAAQGKIDAACVKAGTKAAVAADCPSTDATGVLTKATQKTLADETKNCPGNVPDFAYPGGAAANDAAVRHELALLADVYGGTDLSGVISTSKAIGACQAAMEKGVEKAAAAVQKDYAACKKAALKGGAVAAAGLTSCVGGDTKGKVAAAITKLQADAASKCAGVTIADAFPGHCLDATAATLGGCLGARAKCRMCEAINEMDGVDADCDLLDDGAQNASCGLKVQTCTLGGGSSLLMYAAPYSAAVITPIVGSTLAIGGLHGVGHCEIGAFSPVNVVGVGVLCITPASGCGDAARYCGPGAAGSGPALGVDVESDGNIGTCSGNTDCSAACDSHCAATGTTQLSSGCTGFCSGSHPADTPCTTDAACVGAGNGGCNGPNHTTHTGVCQCTCVKRDAFGGSDPGDLSCTLGMHLRIESAAPCDGTDVLIDYGTMCVPFSTQEAKGKIVDANFATGATVPGNPPGANANDHQGTPLACSTIEGGSTSGLQGFGAFTLFGTSPLGDLSFALRATCQ